ncbi:MAG: SDR family oxidoreductase [Flavobacteriales bacterium]|nr:SDR family oxidoreductase [Flavobacteriales bacterium]
MDTTLITGATGSLGGSVARMLNEKKENSNIAVLVRDVNADKAKELEALGFELRQGDYDDRASLVSAFQNVSQLYFVSGSDIANRTKQHENVVSAAKEANVGHVFYTGVSMNDIDTNSSLYFSLKVHELTEKWIKESGLKYTFLRHNLYAEVIPMFLGSKEQIVQSKMVYLPTENGRTAFVPRVDLAEAGANILANPTAFVNKSVELNGAEKVTFEEVANYLSDITGESIAYVSPEIAEFEKVMTENKVPAEYIGMMSAFGEGIANQVFDTPSSQLEDILGRKNQSVKDFLAEVYG